MPQRSVIVGGGIFGASAAVELARRGDRVILCDPGPLPHPLAESTDVSKIVRGDYGSDGDYLALMIDSLDGWRRWNAAWREPLYHETGVLFLARERLEGGGFEHDSLAALTAAGFPVERLDAAAIRARFPAWNADRYVDGYFNAWGGWAESGRVVTHLLDEARALGVAVLDETPVIALDGEGDRLDGIVLGDGLHLDCDRVIVCAGAWSGELLGDLAPPLATVGQPVFHLAPRDPAPFRADRFPVFGADIARTGWYGFPVADSGELKIANHGPGRAMAPGDAAARVVTEAEIASLRAFLSDTFPALADAPLARTRVCVYCDTPDEHFLIARHPRVDNLVVATGGSGHAFKFAPVLGGLIADAADGIARPALTKFAWREGSVRRGEEPARHRG